MDWKEYELAVFNLLKDEYPNSIVSHNVYVEGFLSKKKRQIDILLEENVGGNSIKTIVDTKFYHRKVDVKGVESFIGMLSDVKADKGIIVSQQGFSSTAARRAFYDNTFAIEVEIFNFNDLKQFQAFGAIPYTGNHGVLINAPLGWIIDGKRNSDTPATLYRRGLSLEEAKNYLEFMYINFCDKVKDNETLADLVKKQESHLFEFYGNGSEIKYFDGISRSDAKTLIRQVFISDSIIEYTAFVSFKEFIFFCVLITPIEMSKKNLRKLNNVAARSIPINISQPASK